MRIDEGRGQKTLWKRSHLFPVLASNNHYCHPVAGVFETSILQSHAICPNFFAEVAQWYRKSSEIELTRACVDYIIFWAAPCPWIAVVKFKTTKINSEGFLWFSTKFSTPENYPPYGTWYLYTCTCLWIKSFPTMSRSTLKNTRHHLLRMLEGVRVEYHCSDCTVFATLWFLCSLAVQIMSLL